MTKTPEQWLEEASPKKEQGIFKLFLGYAPGVGKTYNMLSEGIRRKSRGEDVVLGLVETIGAFYVSSAYKDIIAYTLLILILLVRPQGLLGAGRNRPD